jgi:hypothetical protein
MSTHTHPLTRLLICVVLIAALLSACAQAAPQLSKSMEGAPESAARDYGGAAPAMEAPAAPAAQAPAQNAAGGANQPQLNPEAVAQAPRIVIKNGNLTVVVPDPAATMKKITAMAEEMGGYVVSANMYKQTTNNGIEVPRVSITIRVPAARMDEAMQNIEAEASQEPQNVTITSQDVTSEYVDLQSRLTNLEAAEKDLTRIMNDANRTEDVLNVYNQLVSIREQIEVTKGQIKYYEQSAALSAISAEIIADAAVQPIEIGGWQPQGVAKDAIESLIQTLQGLASFLIWLIIYILPVLLILFVIFVLPIILIVRYWRRRRAARKTIAQPPAPAA